jgi:hypothetical protein
MDIKMRAVFSITFFTTVLLYVWLKIRDKIHGFVEDSFAFAKKDELEGVDLSEDEPPPSYKFTALSISSVSIMFRVFFMILGLYLSVLILKFLASMMYPQAPSQGLLEMFGMKFLKDFNVVDETRKTLDTGKIISVLTEICTQFKILAYATLSCIGVVWTYKKWAILPEDTTNEEGMHMHVDVVMFIILFIYIIAIHTIYRHLYKSKHSPYK